MANLLLPVTAPTQSPASENGRSLSEPAAPLRANSLAPLAWKDSIRQFLKRNCKVHDEPVTFPGMIDFSIELHFDAAGGH
jgi:hypothetical protein